MVIPDFEVSSFKGLNTFVKDTKTLKPGVATSSLNWLTSTFGDHIALRRGSALLGQTREEGEGKITGMGVGVVGSRHIPFFSHGTKVRYYDSDEDDTFETATQEDIDILGAAADGVDVWFAPYHGLSGSFMYVGSQDSATFKIPVANPGSAVNQEISGSYRFKVLKISQGRSFAGQRKGDDGKRDDTSLYLSWIDRATFDQFSQITNEVVGDVGGQVFEGNLDDITGILTAFLVVFEESGGETISDNGDGTLTGTQGSSGTINYATGEYIVNFNHVTTGAVTVDYFYESTEETSILDFTFSTDPRVAGEGNQFLQADGGGKLKAIMSFINIEYCLHQFKTWQYTAALDDTESTNLLYRNVGIPYERAAFPTPDGILIVDTSNPSDPKVRRIEIGQNTDVLTVVPTSISDALDLSIHAFDYAVTFRWGDLEIVCCQNYTNAVANSYNSAMYARNVVSSAWDRLDFRATCLAELLGTLIAGDSLSNNIFTLFSGFDDDGSVIENHWQDGQMNLGTSNLKRFHRMVVRGLIQKEQRIRVSISLDGGPFTSAYIIEGDESYVDAGINTSIGSYTVGSKVIGGGGDATAHPFEVDFPLHTDRFQFISVRFEALDVGYAQIDSYKFKDIRDKGRRSTPVNTV